LARKLDMLKRWDV
jgi:hypothetical protein